MGVKQPYMQCYRLIARYFICSSLHLRKEPCCCITMCCKVYPQYSIYSSVALGLQVQQSTCYHVKLMQSCPEADLSLYSSVISVTLLVLLIPQLHCSLLVVYGVSYGHSNGQTEKAIHYNYAHNMEVLTGLNMWPHLPLCLLYGHIVMILVE